MRKILFICFAVLLCSACSDDFLNIPPKSSSTEGNFFITQDHFTQAVNNAYASMRSLYDDKAYVMTEMRSDNTHYTRYDAARGYPSTDREKIADFTVAIENSVVRDMWKSCYSTISKTNAILDRIESKDFPAEFKNNIIGQARFIRAFGYFYLVQLYGGVPLQMNEVTSSENVQIARSSVDEVYTAIITDVKDAVEKLKPVSFPQSGAATQGAAKMLYAYVLMTKPQRDYAEAEKQLLDITKMGYDLETEYADVFEPSKKNSKEHIFSIQYQQGEQGQQSNWLYKFIPKSANASVITGVDGTNSMDDGGWNVPTQSVIDIFPAGDKRLDVSIGVAVANGIDTYTKIENWFNPGDSRINDYDLSVPFIRKYLHTHSKINNTDDNWPVYRYSDALLLLAECVVEQGRAGEANQYLNKVRTRAGLAPFNGAVTADIVADERRLELVFENHRWFDLVRTGKAVETMTEYGKYIKSVDRGVTDASYNIKPGYLVYPIPFQEMERNKELTQNEAYLN